MPINYLVEIFRLDGGSNLSEIERLCFVSDSPFSVGIGRSDISGGESAVFLDCPKRILIKDNSISSSHGYINFGGDGSVSYHDKGSTNGSYMARKDGEGLTINRERISNISGRDLYVVLAQNILLHIYSQQDNAASTQRIPRPEGLLPVNPSIIPTQKRKIIIRRPK